MKRLRLDNMASHNTPKQKAPIEPERRTAEIGNFAAGQLQAARILNIIIGIIGLASIAALVFLTLTVEEANRAWVGVIWDQAHSEGPDLYFRIRLVNFGREPATRLTYSEYPIYFIPLPNGLAPGNIGWQQVHDCTAQESNPRGMVVYPVPEASTDNPSLDIPIQRTIESQMGIKGMLQGTQAAVVSGCIAYDSFLGNHHAEYCFVERKQLDGTVRAGTCPLGAYAD